MKKNELNKKERKNFNLKITFWDPKKIHTYYYFSISMIALFVVFNISWFIWLAFQSINFKDLPGVEDNFFNGFINNNVDISKTAWFMPKMMFLGFKNGITIKALLIIALIFLFVSILWPLIIEQLIVNYSCRSTEKLRIALSYRKCLVAFYFLIPAIMIIIVQNFYINNNNSFYNSFENQFFKQFTDFQENNLTPLIQEQFEIAKSGALESFNFNVNYIFSIISNILSFLTMFMILLYSSFAYFYIKPKDGKDEHDGLDL
ncbi:hypothetical protein [Spiroplasma alleghenense]|uniref:Transmembrane protein n=1 Tax=Spiroplasma alleghenense TaxID=216931 RepID=A0A345Z4M4_9MOLU|nr:hypothetical protein [Spiroplasma alleghenense]AXK51553.1 hypothetical protein SALLE_v1c08830 [Spiroplasma alleghenense]